MSNVQTHTKRSVWYTRYDTDDSDSGVSNLRSLPVPALQNVSRAPEMWHVSVTALGSTYLP